MIQHFIFCLNIKKIKISRIFAMDPKNLAKNSEGIHEEIWSGGLEEGAEE